jgi:hypothetical protein
MKRNKFGQFTSDPRPELRKRLKINCFQCGKKFEILRYRLKSGKKICCSVSCATKLAMKNPIRREKLSQANTGRKPWNKGIVGVLVGEKSNRWKGGRYYHKDGYVYVYNINHPYKNKDGYVFEHRLIMEKKLNRYLRKDENVHHINGIKDDNKIENLKLLSNSNHLKEEWKNLENNNFKNSKNTWFKKGQMPWNKKYA